MFSSSAAWRSICTGGLLRLFSKFWCCVNVESILLVVWLILNSNDYQITFNNNFIYGTTSQVLVNIHDGGTIADNAIINIMVHDVADGDG